jgi:hypothetical protein
MPIKIKSIEWTPAGVNVFGDEVEVLQLADGSTREIPVKGYAEPVGINDFAADPLNPTPEDHKTAKLKIAEHLEKIMGVGLPIIFQALINMGVAVELFPVTGQTLPLISSGGTSIWMTCMALGIILSVSAKREEMKEREEAEKELDNENPLDILSEAI